MYNSKDPNGYKKVPIDESEEEYLPEPTEIVSDPNDDNRELEENYI